jgi:signal peptidase I
MALKRKHKNQVVGEFCSRLQSISRVLTVVLLLGGLISCKLTNTSRLRIEGKGMEPNLKDGQIVTAQPVEDLSSLQRGDVIIFEWNGNSLIKRLIGLPGETLEIRQGSIIINGEVYDEPYEVMAPEYEQEPIELGQDEYYVLGDNRNDSRDSHQFGPITGEVIKGRVIP